MKKILALLLIVPAFAFADEAPVEVPAILKFFMDMLFAIPGIGPIALEILKYIGVIAAVATALATAFAAIANALRTFAQFAGFVALVDKIEALYAKIWPYLAWLSMYNVQKKK